MKKKQCEVCDTITYCDKHHIHSQSLGGSNDPSNIATVCPNCHREIHAGQIVIEGRFLTTDGYMLIYHMNGEPSITGSEPDTFSY